MFLILGLGNPGLKYKKTRHNVGFMIVEEVRKRGNLPNFRFSKGTRAELSSGFFQGEKIIMAKPQTFMNNSGRTAKLLIKNLKLEKTLRGAVNGSKNLIVVHDDLDFPLGTIRVVKNRGAAGHKGVDSIIKELKTKNFIRLRVGIRTQATRNKRQETSRFVLQKFNKEEEMVLKKVINEACRAVEMILKEGPEKAMTEFNK